MDPAAARTAVLTSVRLLARDTKLYTLALDAPLPFEAGHFVNLTIPGAAPRPERSYSIWSDPVAPGSLEFAIKLFPGGQASEYLRDVPVGTSIHLRGPFGHFTLRPADDPKNPGTIWMFATSTGLAPFHAMLSVAARTGDPRRFRLLFGCRDKEDVFGVEELDRLAQKLDLSYAICLSQPTVVEHPWRNCLRGRITAHLPEIAQSDRYYLCGNGAMITEARELLKAAGADRKRIHFEKYW